jgi:CpeT protein
MKQVLVLLMLLSFTQIKAQNKIKEADLRNLYNLMIGSFSSENQSKDDSSYFDIRLKMVPMWSESEYYWLYVEQAMATNENKPYRQRVYRISKLNDTTIESRVYTIKNGEQYFGEWKLENPLANLTIDSLDERKGCSIFLNKINKNEFSGSTNKSDCESSLKGASYATSFVNIYTDMIISWDRGFDKDDNQVWGAENGGYIFVKLENY